MFIFNMIILSYMVNKILIKYFMCVDNKSESVLKKNAIPSVVCRAIDVF